MVRAFFVTLLILCLVSTSLGGNAALVEAGSNTAIEDTAVIDKLTIFDGQQIRNSGPNFATLVLPGTSMRLFDSAIVYHSSWADWISGTISVVTSSGFAIKTSCLSVQPANKSLTRFTVAPYQGRLYVSAQFGDLIVKGRKEVRVQQTRTIVISACGQAAERIESPNLSSTQSKLIFGAAGAAGVVPPLMLRQDLSAEQPGSRR